MNIGKQLEKYSKLWKLSIDFNSVIETAGSIVAQVIYKDKTTILKIYKASSDEANSALILQKYKNGAVEVIKSDDNACLLEKIEPGTHLTELTSKGDDKQATLILCEIIAKILTPYDNSLKATDIRSLAKAFDDDLQIDRNLIKKAKQIYLDLCHSQNKLFLLHGDLHHDNILYDNNKGWLAIDPKGYIGEAEYETGAFLRNPINSPDIYSNEQIIDTRLDVICSKLNFDRKRVIKWAFSQSVLAAIWSLQSGQPLNWALKAANAFYKKI